MLAETVSRVFGISHIWSRVHHRTAASARIVLPDESTAQTFLAWKRGFELDESHSTHLFPLCQRIAATLTEPITLLELRRMHTEDILGS